MADKDPFNAFAPLAANTTVSAPQLVTFAGVKANDKVLDVATGAGVVALAAARLGAQVTGVDFSSGLLAHARKNAEVAGVEIDWCNHDLITMPWPFSDQTFDVVLHQFAPLSKSHVGEMLRVLKVGGSISIAAWLDESFMSRMLGLFDKYDGIDSNFAQRMVPQLFKDFLGPAVTDLTFDYDTIRFPALSPGHLRQTFEQHVPTCIRILAEQSESTVAAFRREFDLLIPQYYDWSSNTLRQTFIMARAKKI